MDGIAAVGPPRWSHGPDPGHPINVGPAPRRLIHSSLGGKLVVGFVNLHDSTAVTLNFDPASLRASLLEADKLHPKSTAPLFYTAASSFRNRAENTTKLFEEAAARRADAAELVSRCWALHDTCLLDTQLEATTSPSCPDHTALNAPATSSVYGRTTRTTEPIEEIMTESRSRVQPASLGVSVSRVPPEWGHIARVDRRPNASPSLTKKANQIKASLSGNSSPLVSKSLLKQKRRDQINQKRAHKGKPPRIWPSQDPGPEQMALDMTEGNTFQFHGDFTLLPLSATLCEIELEDPHGPP